MSDTIQDIAYMPELDDGEEIIESVKLNNGIYMIAITNKSMFIRPVKGKVDLADDSQLFDVRLGDIESVREKKGIVQSKISIEQTDDLLVLPKMSEEKSEEVIEAIVETENLKESEWENEGNSDTDKAARGILATTLGGLGIVGSLVAVVSGLLFILLGAMISLTIIGAIIGVPLIIFGWLIISAGTGIAAIGFGSGAVLGGSINNGQKEWVRENDSEM